MYKDFNWVLFGLIISTVCLEDFFMWVCIHKHTRIKTERVAYELLMLRTDWKQNYYYYYVQYSFILDALVISQFFFTPCFWNWKKKEFTSRLSHSIHWVCSNINIIIIKVYKSTIVCFIILYTHRKKILLSMFDVIRKYFWIWLFCFVFIFLIERQRLGNELFNRKDKFIIKFP